jgi:hypothetical protein
VDPLKRALAGTSDLALEVALRRAIRASLGGLDNI